MQSAYLNHSRRLLSAMIIVCVLFQNSLASGFYQVAQTQTNQSASTDIHVLASTGTVEREIKGGEVHQYQLSVAKDQYFRVSIEQDNMDLEVQVF
ncbi:MAG TPA: hypothetical protein VEF04_17890, partial [Blastocatellia bacterium]|nr:hypothetical protein [Blastocatellia bacterium]